MSIFDPLGILAPVLIHGRLLMQDLCQAHIDWDEQMSDDEFAKWTKWAATLPNMFELKIPRWYFKGASSIPQEPMQLHVFTDASEQAYGCVAYFRVNDGGEIRCASVMSRSKVAPLKHLSVSRLELQAALLGARLMKAVCDNHDYNVREKYIHTDSQVVLSWLRSPRREFKPSIAHRIGEIRTLTDSASWRYVPTKENPADCLTKWNKDTDINKKGRWLIGKSFLYHPEELWPEQKTVEPTMEERRVPMLTHSITPPAMSLIDPTRISKWKILLRTIVIVHRFVENCKLKQKGETTKALKATENQAKVILRVERTAITPIESEELQRAEILLYKLAQTECYHKELKILSQQKNDEAKSGIDKTSPLYNIDPFTDEMGILRVNGRTANAIHIPYDARFPIILRQQHAITSLLLGHYHEKYGHVNRETVVNEIRQRFYIPFLRAAVDRAMKSCQRCKVKKCRGR